MLKTALCRGMMTTVANTRKPRPEGTIASVFASLAGEEDAALPERFAALKREIISNESQAQALKQSWADLCHHLQESSNEIAEHGSALIPEVEFQDIVSGLDKTSIDNIKKRGVVITRNVIPQDKAEEWLASIKDYIAKNPQVKGFPADDKQVFEIYWSKAQIQARSHPNSLAVQKFLLSLFEHEPSKTATSSADLLTPLTYCDRLRIRKPGDSQFALGPHVDGGSIERWEDEIYRKSYEKILQGRWRDHDPWNIGSRPEANMNLYEGPGACGVFRAMQGWEKRNQFSVNQFWSQPLTRYI